MKIFYLAFILILLSSNYAKAEFQPKQVTELNQFPPGPSFFGQSKSTIRIHFLIESSADFSKLGITGVDLCSTLESCERINELQTGAFVKDDHITFGHAVTASGDKGIYVHLQTTALENTAPKILNPLITLNKPIIFEMDLGYEAFIKLEKTVAGDYQAELMAYAPAPPVSEGRIMLYEPNKEYRVSLDGGFEVSLPKGATDQPEILLFSTDRKARNHGWLHIFPSLVFNLPVSITVKFDFQVNGPNNNQANLDKTPDTINKYKIYNVFGEDNANDYFVPEYVDTDANGVEAYLIETTKSGLFFIDKKDPFSDSYLNSSQFSMANKVAYVNNGCLRCRDKKNG